MLTFTQKIAKKLGKVDKHGRNTWFGSDINHPNNTSLRLSHNTSISLGAINKSHLFLIIKENKMALLSNTFAPSLDDKRT